MSKKIKSPQNNLSQLSNFEQELFIAMKSYGFLFPESSREVERFEELYGKTPINTPENFELNPSKPAIVNYDLGNEFKMVAFTPPSDDSLQPPDGN